MEIKQKNIASEKFDEIEQGVVLLPKNYLVDTGYKYPSSTISFQKFAKDKMDIKCMNEPELLYEQQSSEWFGPMFLITSAALSQNSALISIMCGVISNYVTQFFSGIIDPKVDLTIVYKETKTTKLSEFSYKGGIQGLNKLENAIKDHIKKSNPSEKQ